MSKAQLGAGNVAFELDGEDAVLKPSLKAAQAISRHAGGVRAALQAVAGLDFDTIVHVVGLGLGAEGRELKALPEKVYATGLAELVAPVTRYLVIIANGGRPADETDGGEGDENPPR